jgi:hypothetical protein
MANAAFHSILPRAMGIPLLVSSEPDTTLVGIAAHAQMGLGIEPRLATPAAQSLDQPTPFDNLARERLAQAVDLRKGWWA